MRYGLILSFCLRLLWVNTAIAQQNLPVASDPLQQQLYLYKLAKPQAKLFVHFDKNIYTNNETAWFTGYLLNEQQPEIQKHDVMSVALIRNADSLVVKQQKFIMAAGLSFGSMVLPDSMLTGDYHFIASTNRVCNGVPDVVFIQPIVIKTNISPAFNASIKILEPGVAGKKPHQVLLTATTRDARFLPKPVEVTYRYGKVYQKTKTNVSGELILKLEGQVNLTDPNIYVQLKYGRDSSFLNLALPVTIQKAKVGFYPEGGNLVNGVPGLVAWEVKDQQGGVVALKAQLYKNRTLIDTIETNSYGIGKFMLTPEQGNTYQVKLLHSGFADSTYLLPAVQDKGIGLYTPKAVVKDTLTVGLRGHQRGKLFIRVHNYRETFIYNGLDVKAPQTNLRIALETVPKGLTTLTIADSLNRPLAERIFFAHYEPRRKISILTDQPVYEQRKKVKLKIKLHQPDTLAVVSVACIQDNRMSLKLTSDIESYAYLSSLLHDLPSHTTRGYDDQSYLEDVMLVKGWRRYTWPDVMQVRPADTLRTYDPTVLSLQLSRPKKPIGQAVQIGLIKSNSVKLLSTDDKGFLAFGTADLMVEKERPIHVFAGGNGKTDYQININDPYLALNKSYVKLFGPEYRAAPSAVPNNNTLSLKSNEKAIRLKEVQITAGRDLSLLHGSGPNACGDYVCRYNILNCFNHVGDAGNRPPVPGRQYKFNGGTTVYQECKPEPIAPNMAVMDGIYGRKEFYLNAYADPLEPAFVSTIFWDNAVLLDRREKEISFHTSDITGKFKVVVQGVSTNDVLYGDYAFEVKGK